MDSDENLRVPNKSAEEKNETILPENSMSKPLTQAERKRQSRAAQSSEKRKEEKEKDRNRKATKRAAFSKTKKVAKTAAERKRLSRAAQTTEEREEEKEKDRIYKENMRAEFPKKETISFASELEKKATHIRKFRQSLSHEDLETEKFKASIGMKKFRQSLSHENLENERLKARIGMKKFRASQTDEEKIRIKEEKKEQMKKQREEKTDEEKVFIKIEKSHKMRESRQERTGKDHLIQNLEAKRGMRLLRAEGRLISYKTRTSIPHRDKRLDKNLNDWDWYKRGSTTSSILLENKKPDIVSKLNQEWRCIRERELDEIRKREEVEKKGAWIYNPVFDSYSWSGAAEPDLEDSFCYEAPTEEDIKMYDQSVERELEELLRQKKIEEKARREEKAHARSVPLNALPERPLSEYEKIRESNIKEREDAMAKSGFFSDLLSYKKSIGFIEADRM